MLPRHNYFARTGTLIARISPAHGGETAFLAETGSCDRHGDDQMAIKRVREASPLWVWIALALLACSAIAYVTVVAIIEYLMASAS
jgi:hypothetical protein